MLLLAGETAAASQGSIWVTFGPIILMFLVLYFLLIRPQQKRSKVRNSMLQSIKKGDKVVTIGGLHGTIMELTDDTVVLRVNDATKMTFERSAINSIAASSTTAVVEETK